MTAKDPSVESQSEKPRQLSPSGLDSAWIDTYHTSWRVSGHEGAMEIVFSKLDLAAIALAGPGLHNAPYIPQVAVRMTLPQARNLALALLLNFQQMNPADAERCGVLVSELPVVPMKEERGSV